MSGFTAVVAVSSLDKTDLRAEIQTVFSQTTIITNSNLFSQITIITLIKL